MTALMNPRQLALLRGWMNFLGWPLLGQLYLDGADIAATRQQVLQLRQRLALKARQCRWPEWEAFWLAERQPGAAWLQRADAGLQMLLDAPEPVPAPDDPVSQWLPDRLAGKLAAAGLERLRQLVALRQQAGAAAWKGLPKLGGDSARQIEQFLKAHATVLGLDCQPLAIRPAGVPPGATPGNPAIEDLFAAHPELSGAEGRNRAPAERCRIVADNDYLAIQTWLDLRDRDSHTYRNYRNEAERFLLWALSERGKPLSSLDTADCKAYRDFLFNPAQAWLNPVFKPRWSQDWRPFKGPLSPRSVRYTETILSALCAWLCKQRYLDANPFDGLPPLPTRGEEGILVEHALDAAQWRWLLDYCARCEAAPPAGRDSREYRRLWIALQLAYCTGLRLAELAAARFADIHYRSRQGGQYWLAVLGKGGKWREVPLPDALADDLKCYAQTRGVAWGVPDTPAPLIGKFRNTAVAVDFGYATVETPFSASGLHRVLKRFFNEAAEARAMSADGDEARAADGLRRMTTHWLRHTHASHALERGVALLLVKENLGHASLATTSVYLHGDKDQRHVEMSRLYSPKPVE